MPFDFLNLLKELNIIVFKLYEILKLWWWLLLPFILFKPVRFLYRWWRVDLWLNKRKFTVLEIKMPKEVLKPIRAMEVVLSGLRQIIYKPPDFWEKWIDGEVQLSYSFEIASIGGEPHFYVRIPDTVPKDGVEAIIYSQYPEAEITEAEDYTKLVPRDIPNKDWDLWASDYKVLKPSPYPIKTYPKFETEHETKEEKRIDPIAGLLELMAKLKPGEQLWIQIMAEPVSNEDLPWITEGGRIRDELAKRTKKEAPRKPIILEAADVLITGEPPQEKKKEEPMFPPEMKLTPGEKEVISAVEEKISKPGFKASARFIYLGKKGAFKRINLRLAFGYFAFYFTENLNALVPYGPTLTKIKKSWFLPKNLTRQRRLYLRKRRMFRYYCERFDPLYPKNSKFPTSFILNTEELASLFHFPGKSYASAPFVSRVEAKKGEAPMGLPTEDLLEE
ncbi:MAG: hypothetical protein PHI53_01270 [Candidatus Pacebacteria bacterium]|nr:hypothetical protein [Candidatus Paceibacterota bacterium]